MFLSSCTTLVSCVSCILVPSDQFLLLLLVYEKTKKKFTFSCLYGCTYCVLHMFIQFILEILLAC